ncbi:thiamine biosynthesis lipoprotein [Pseudarthrobacter defluvii]|uniref:FAD:protein FMN transferase n=1 Tax=Pseudarthrobacter defluvii TaxID=410837 RepID=UPI00278A2F9F|nr:FAD:protein FMN transferase [Pseudarthrobacter defluvii]MDQ0771527.1 thiamine biosynthesis lipoprotein [Pseudarthrobacter defluvii]
MGTVIGLTMPMDTRAEGQPGLDELAAATAVVERLFRELDDTFSLYRPESEASRIAHGELKLPHASAQMRERYAEAHEWRLRTEGAFTPERPDGVLDLSGIIKGHAIREAGATLLALGLRDWCLNAGGDVLVSGSPHPGSAEPWKAGVVDPADRRTLITGYALGGKSRHSAIATSGSAERGEHIWRVGKEAHEAGEFVQVTVAAGDIVTADVLATAIVAGGTPMLNRAADSWDVAVLAVRADGSMLATPGFQPA